MQKVIFVELAVARKEQFIADITENLYLNGKKVHIFAAGSEALNKINTLLWVRKPDSFLPHTIFKNDNESAQELIEPIVLIDQPVDFTADALILNDPFDISRIGDYPMIIDFAETYDPVRLKASRERYKAFRDDGRFELSFEKFGSFLKLIKAT